MMAIVRPCHSHQPCSIRFARFVAKPSDAPNSSSSRPFDPAILQRSLR